VSDESLQQAIFDHLALAERNRKLELRMPINRYRDLYGSDGGRVAEHDEPATGPDSFVPDIQWDDTGERPLPTFEDWDDD
jgi:hypothetical protein